MAIRKIKAALVNTRDAPDYNTEVGYLFYDANPNGDRTLRISDGVTPGGIPLLASGDSSVGLSSATLKVADDSSTSSTFDLSGTGETLKIAGTGGITTSISGDTLTIDGTAVQGASSLSVFADDSTNMEVDLNNQDLTVSGGNSITTSTSSTQTLTVDLNPDISVNNISPLDSSGVNINGNLYVNGNSVISQGDNISSLTNDAGYITDTTLNVVADDSQTININNGGTLQFSGGNNITTSTSSDGIVTISGPSNVSDLTNDSGYISSATLKVVGDDSTGTVFDASKGDDIRFLGAGNVSVTVSGSTVIITGTGGDSSGGGGGTTYTQDTAPSSPVDGDTWLDTDSGALYVYVVEGGYGQWIETGSAGSTLDVDGVDSIRFAADDSTSTAVATSETLSILGGQGIETSVTGTGEIRISSTGSSVTTSDAQPSNPNDGDLWYETDS